MGDSAGDLHNVFVRDLPEQGNGRCGIGDQMMLVQVPAPSVRAQADEHAVDQRPADRQRARAPRVCPRQEQALRYQVARRSPGRQSRYSRGSPQWRTTPPPRSSILVRSTSCRRTVRRQAVRNAPASIGPSMTKANVML